jgi:hypothetical protein
VIRQADNIRLYEESLLAVNKNRLSIQQQGNESDAYYIARMDAICQEKYDTNLYEEKAKLEEIQKFKINLKRLLEKMKSLKMSLNHLQETKYFKQIKTFLSLRLHV